MSKPLPTAARPSHQIRNQPVELIITDLNMPVMNGLTFLRELNREQPASNVIMITAYGEVESYLEALNLGAFEYLNKPVKLDELKKIMRKMFHEPPDHLRRDCNETVCKKFCSPPIFLTAPRRPVPTP